VRGVIEAAIDTVSPGLQAKVMRIDLSIADDLPSLLDSGDEFYRMVVQALTGACLVSSANSRLLVTAQQVTSQSENGERPSDRRFLCLTVGDEGGRPSHDLYALAIGDQESQSSVQHEIDLTELSAAVENAANLASAHGLRRRAAN
jgi:hypothetical protein